MFDWKTMLDGMALAAFGMLCTLFVQYCTHWLTRSRERQNLINTRLWGLYSRLLGYLAAHLESAENRFGQTLIIPNEGPDLVRWRENYASLQQKGLDLQCRIVETIFQLQTIEPDDQMRGEVGASRHLHLRQQL
jgi:hypothetical protein